MAHSGILRADLVKHTIPIAFDAVPIEDHVVVVDFFNARSLAYSAYRELIELGRFVQIHRNGVDWDAAAFRATNGATWVSRNPLQYPLEPRGLCVWWVSL